MKKYIVGLLVILSLFLLYTPDLGASCDYNGGSIKSSLDNCFRGNATTVVTTSGDLEVAGGLKAQILKWNRIISGVFGLLAVGSIVYGGLIFVMSGGTDDRVTKGKMVIKWAVIGLLLLVAASTIVAVVVNIMFGIQS